MYDKCLNLLLDCEDSRVKLELLKIVNHRDSTNNVPLHYATNLWPQCITRKLLERGANIGVKNDWNEIPISKIMPEVNTNEGILRIFYLEGLRYDESKNILSKS